MKKVNNECDTHGSLRDNKQKENICDCDNQQPDPITHYSICENCGGDIHI